MNFDSWIEQEHGGRQLFLKALKMTGLDKVMLFKNPDPFGIDVLIMLEGETNCVGVIEIENSTGNTWNYKRYYSQDRSLPPLTWRNRKQITIPYRRLPRFLNPTNILAVNGNDIHLPDDWNRRFYQKWDSSLMAFYLIDFRTARMAITKGNFTYLPNNQFANTFQKEYKWLFDQHGCMDYWLPDIGNRFINIFPYLTNISWGAFGNTDYPVHKAVSLVWKRCGIKFNQLPKDMTSSGQRTLEIAQL